MKRKQALRWGLVSLVIFLFINVLMSFPQLTMANKGFESPVDLLKSSLIAIVLFGIPLVIIFLKKRVGYYFLAIVQIMYLFGYVGAVTMLSMDNNSWSFPITLLLDFLIVLAMGAGIYWLYLAWKIRKSTQKERLARYIKIRDVEIKKDKKNEN